MGGGLAALGLGLMQATGKAAPLRAPYARPLAGMPRGGTALDASRPFASVPLAPRSIDVEGFPFAPGFLGDPFAMAEVPFHTPETGFPGGAPPRPDREVDVAIVGGGLSGLASAWFLKHRRPVLFELHPRFGGVSQGEVWDGTHVSQGGAYFIAPDPGSFLERFYRSLDLDQVARVSTPDVDPVELSGVLRDGFFAGPGNETFDGRAFRRYAEIVRRFADEAYPEIPLVAGGRAAVLELDRKTLLEDITERMNGVEIPPVLASAIQAYCYSSFNAGWETLSAAAGWNFIAAEEFGRWVCPGGNAWVADELWRRLALEHGDLAPELLRPATRVVDVRRTADGRFLVTSREPDGSFRALSARRVVMACSKHVCKHVLHRLLDLDPERRDAMNQVVTTPYLVVNVLLERAVVADWYDAFLLDDGFLPMIADSPEACERPVDVVLGQYARPKPWSSGVLTLYWPIPSGKVMFRLLADGAFDTYAKQLVPHLARLLRILGVARRDVRQVRMTRWGHAMPVARAGFIDDGTADKLRSPYQEHVWFANQDNWALPAFETAVLEAKHFADVVDGSL